MSLNSAAVELSNGLKTIGVTWEEVSEGWKDPVSRDFESEHLIPLLNHVRAVIQAMDRLTPILARAVRDCS
jgi:hypothetical protein